MLATGSLRRALATIALTPFDGLLYRVVPAGVLYGFSAAGPYTPRPLYNLGPPTGGARYTPRGGAPAIYLAGDIATAMYETLQVPHTMPLSPPAHGTALVVYNVRVKLERLLDLTSSPMLRVLATTPTELSEPWRFRRDRRKPPTHRLGAAAAASQRIQGIRFASTKGPGDCCVIFTERVTPPSLVEVADPAGRLVERIP